MSGATPEGLSGLPAQEFSPAHTAQAFRTAASAIRFAAGSAKAYQAIKWHAMASEVEAMANAIDEAAIARAAGVRQ